MSNNLADIAGEEYEWLVEVKKGYDSRHLLEMKLKLDDSDTDKVLWVQINHIDEDIEQLIDSNQKEDWMDVGRFSTYNKRSGYSIRCLGD